MLEIDYSKDSGPSTRGEKITYYSFLVLMLLGFSLDIATDYEPGKLAAIAFLVAWIPLTFIHELGHAIAAKLVGWEVKELVVGIGKIMKEFHFGRAKIELRTIPIGGYMLPDYSEKNWGRLKSAFVYFAGPGIELLICLLIYSFLGFDKFADADGSTFELILQGVGLSALTGAVLNLIPMSSITNEGEIANDGLGILLSLFGRRPF